MKLGFVFDVRFTEYNGEYYSTNLTQNFWQKRYLGLFDEIVVVGRYVKADTNPEGRLVKSSSDRVHFCCIKDCSNINRLLSIAKQNSFIEQAIKDCDRVICRGWWGVSVCKKLGIPYLIEVVSCVWDSYWNHSLMGKLVALPNYLLQKNVVKTAPYVCYVTQEFLQKRYPASFKNVGISDVELKNEPAAEKIEVLEKRLRKICNGDSKIVIGTAAAVSVKYKGQKFVIQALAQLKRKGYTNFEYQLAGRGDTSYLQSIAQKYHVEDQVKFIGPIPHDQIFDWYDRLDVYIQPSLQEGLPRAVVEAMSRALPCLGTNTGGIPELIEPAYICNKRKNLVAEIANQLENLNKEKLMQMAKRNIEFSDSFDSELLDRKRLQFLSDFTIGV